MRRIADPEVQLLATIAATLEKDYDDDDLAWLGSPFAWLKTRSSRQVGKICEDIVAGWLAAKGFDVSRSPDSDADKIVEGKRVEIKASTLWKSGMYKFQQIRDQNYELAVCLGISPFDAHCWVIPKQVLMEQWHTGGGLSSQHGGASGTDTAWLSVVPGKEPQWLSQHGGRLAAAVQRLRAITGFHD